MPINKVCGQCGGSEIFEIDTYKRVWRLCRKCGAGYPTQKSRYPLAFLPGPDFLKKSAQHEEDMYGYFVSDSHIAYSIETAKEFRQDHLNRTGVSLSGKHVLDVSAGNAHFAAEFRGEAASMTVTEIHRPSIAYAREKLGLEAYYFNFASGALRSILPRKYDVVMARAAIMFCADLRGFARDLWEILTPGGFVFINHSVIPTLGVLTRVQFDEFSYMVLRQPEAVAADFDAAGFDLVSRKDETDPSLYVYDHDLKKTWMALHYWYEISGALKLGDFATYPFRARDRRRSTLLFKKRETK